MRRIQRGFTLVELMIVVAIIGILAAIAIPNYIRFQAKSKQAEARTNLRAISTGQTARFAERDRYSSLIAEIGFAPERGNRYLYDLGPMGGGFAACGNTPGTFEPRGGPTVVAGSYTGVAADENRYGPAYSAAGVLIANMGAGVGTVTWRLSGGSGTVIAPATFGYDLANCPSCDFAACAVGNIDNDIASDVWVMGSQFSTLGASACAEATPGGLENQPGSQVNAKSDVSCML